MSKKGRQLRQIKKQLKQIQKLQKRAKQKGIQLTESVSEVESTEYRKLSEVKAKKKQIEKALTGRQEPTTPTTQNTVFKPTQKQLTQAIQKRKLRTARPNIKTVRTPNVTEETLKNRKVKQLRKKLEEARQQKLKKPKQETIEQPTIEPTEEPEELPPILPPTGEHYERADATNTDPSFFAKVVITNYLWEVGKFPNSAYPIIKDWLDRLINSRGEQSVAEMLQEGANSGVILTYDVAYSEKLYGYLADMLTFLPDSTDWEREEIMEQFESWEDIL